MELAKIEQKAKDADTEAVALLQSAQALIITSPAGFQASGAVLKQIVTAKKALLKTRTDVTQPMDAAKKAVMELFKPVAERFESAEATLRAAMATFSQAEAGKQAEIQERLDELARKDRERLETRAAKQRERGNEEEAEALEATAEQVTAAEAAEPTKVAGVHTVTTWSAEVTDIQALIQACADGKTPGGPRLVEPNMPALNALAREFKDKLDIPGVRAVSTTSTAVRA
jgi:hypothetical protein